MKLRAVSAMAVVSLSIAAGCADDSDTASNVPTSEPATTVAATSPPASTAPPTAAPADSDLEVIEAGVAAFYSGDADRAAELFELTDRTDDQIRDESAYQAAIGGRLKLSCAQTAPGSFRCSTPYFNAMTDAIGLGGGHDRWPVVVENGVITQFGFTEHTGVLIEMGMYLASQGRFDGYEDCIFGPFPASCAALQLANLDAWAARHETMEPADAIRAVVESWYRGDCEAAALLSWGDTDCSATSVAAQTVAYESILGAQVSVENCTSTTSGDGQVLSCQVRYSNALNRAVDKAPSVITRDFVLVQGVLSTGPDETLWYEVDYPEDVELRDSFRLFAQGGELASAYAAAGCASARTRECANLIVDNLDAWATWYDTNG